MMRLRLSACGFITWHDFTLREVTGEEIVVGCDVLVADCILLGLHAQTHIVNVELAANLLTKGVHLVLHAEVPFGNVMPRRTCPWLTTEPISAKEDCWGDGVTSRMQTRISSEPSSMLKHHLQNY